MGEELRPSEPSAEHPKFSFPENWESVTVVAHDRGASQSGHPDFRTVFADMAEELGLNLNQIDIDADMESVVLKSNVVKPEKLSVLARLLDYYQSERNTVTFTPPTDKQKTAPEAVVLKIGVQAREASHPNSDQPNGPLAA